MESINKVKSPENIQYGVNKSSGSSSPADNGKSALVEIIDVINHKFASAKPLLNVIENDGYIISNSTNIDGVNVVFAEKEGENSLLYLVDKNNELIGKIIMDSNEKVINSTYDAQTNTITAEMESGKKIKYNMERIEASIKLASDYEHTNTGKYYKNNGIKYVEVAEKELGKPYVWGGVGPDGYDCSGLVSYVLTGKHERLGTTYTFLEWPQVDNPMPGDVCVNSEHTGIYICDGQMIHAATYGVGVIVGPVQEGMIYVRYNGDK